MYADAFCEPGFFSPDQTRRYLDAARLHGMRLRVHCDEMAYGGAAAMAAQLGVDAVDHCNFIDDGDVRAIAERGIVTVACPATIAYLDLPRRAPVRALLEAGGDRGASERLQSRARRHASTCKRSRISGESFSGCPRPRRSTASRARRRTRCASMPGRIRAGGPADFVALQIESPEEFGWQFGGNLARAAS